jgi:hypothetical protein
MFIVDALMLRVIDVEPSSMTMSDAAAAVTDVASTQVSVPRGFVPTHVCYFTLLSIRCITTITSVACGARRARFIFGRENERFCVTPRARARRKTNSVTRLCPVHGSVFISQLCAKMHAYQRCYNGASFFDI